MAEPHASTLAQVVVGSAGGISLLAGTLWGLPVPALVFGFVGALAALKINGDGKLWARASTVALGTFIAGACAHPVAEVLHPADTPTSIWIAPAAIVIGFGAEKLLRTALLALVNRINQVGGIKGD